MRDLFREYRQGKITWDEAYATANNIAATTSSLPGTRDEELPSVLSDEGLVEALLNLLKETDLGNRTGGISC